MSLRSSRRRLGLGVGHAGGRLVDEQQLRLLGEQHADLQPLLLAVAEIGGADVARVGEADRVEDLVDARRRRAVAAVSKSAGEGTALAGERELEIVLDGVALEDGRLLEFPADAEPGDLGLVEPGEVDLAVEIDLARSGRVLPVTMSIIVVLPAPFGPMMARISPGSMTSDSSLSARKPSKETETPSR